MNALACVLSVLNIPAGAIRLGITAIELLTRTAGAYACAASLGWFTPPDLSEEVVQAAQAKAASLRKPRGPHKGPDGSQDQIPKDQKAAHDDDTDMTKQTGSAVKTEEQSAGRVRHSSDRGGHHRGSSEVLDKDERLDDDNVEGEPLVEYGDDQAQAGNQYDGGDDYNEAAGEENYGEGSQDQADQQYNEQYGEGDEDQQNDYQDEQDQQYDDMQQGDDPDQLHDERDEPDQGGDDALQQLNNRGPNDSRDEWDIPESGVTSTTNRLA